MTLGQLQTLCLSWLDDPNAGYFTLPQVNVWLNNAQRETQKLMLLAGENYYVKRVQTTTVTNQQSYVLPNDFLELHRMEVVISGVPPFENTIPMAPITTNQQDLVPNQTGQPLCYFLLKNRIFLWPTPNSQIILRIYYTPVVQDMVLQSDVPNVPDAYQEFLAVLATIDGLLKDQRDPTPLIAKREYYERMLKSEAQKRRVDTPRRVVSTGEGSGYTFGYY